MHAAAFVADCVGAGTHLGGAHRVVVVGDIGADRIVGREVCDRFTDATYAYQAGGSGMDWSRIAELERWVQGDLQPDLTLYFDLAPEIGKTRTRAARDPDRFEREKLDFYTRVRAAYLRRAQEHPQRIRVIDAARSIPEIQVDLQKIISNT